MIMRRLTDENSRKSYYIFFPVTVLIIFVGNCPLYISFCNQGISKSISAGSFKLSQQIEVNE